ncbi:class I SAM-dependent methyltransferase [Rhodobacteraceae bacterium NNCM2]|nr:class I SAM-dependent methyltransferase [Coraliihabitans acroporae]
MFQNLLSRLTGHHGRGAAPDIVIDSSGIFQINGTTFRIDMGWAGKRAKSDETAFTIVKNEGFFDLYKDIHKDAPKSIFEIGFFEGGSSVFFNEYFSPDQITCVDRRRDPIEPVDSYIVEKGYSDRFRMVYSFDQGDKKGLRDLVRTHHDSTLDLVVDDASHQHALTKATFEALYPFVRPGGKYIIEDYGWAHVPPYQGEDHLWFAQPSLVNLLFELTVLISNRPDLISKIEIFSPLAVLTRGPAAIDPDSFSIDELLLMRGRSLNLI